MPSLENWGRALARAAKQANEPSITPYTLRHCCATMMLAAGVSPGEAARRLGHSVETLLKHYAGVMADDEATANRRIEVAYAAL
jgi:integrase